MIMISDEVVASVKAAAKKIGKTPEEYIDMFQEISPEYVAALRKRITPNEQADGQAKKDHPANA